jgi:hypothetical protein
MDAPYYNGEPGAKPYDRPQPSADGGKCKRYLPGGVDTCQCGLCVLQREKYWAAAELVKEFHEDDAA